MKGLSLKLVPVLGAIAILFGATYLYAGAKAVIAGERMGGAFAAVFGFAGIALGLALFRARRLLRAHAEARSADGG